jgi:adenosine deaminase
MKFDHHRLKALPKVLLHEHLDGVLRPQTVIDLAREAKYRDLPSDNPRPWLNGSIKAPTRGAWRNIWKALLTPSP